MDIVVVGNGAIGMMAAIELARHSPTASISIIGNFTRAHSASTAAGAMANVLAEVESVPASQMKLESSSLQVGSRSSESWIEFLKNTNGSSCITAKDTMLMLKKGASDFERRNFHEARDVAMGLGRAIDESASDVLDDFLYKPELFEETLRLIGEFALDTHELFIHLDGLVRSLGVTLIDENVAHVDPDKRSVITTSGTPISYDFCIVAAGAFSASLLPPGLTMPMLQGVGTALLARKYSGNQAGLKYVVRTVNRGGAQCGVHFVPRSNGDLYIGAGNTVTLPGDPQLRFETVRYLFTAAEREFIGPSRAYHLHGELALGLRPKTFDGMPLIGRFDRYPSLFMATGTNRVGLTWAPEIAVFLRNSIFGLPTASEFEDWAPDRKISSYGSEGESLDFFVESRLAAALEHKLVSDDPRSLGAKRAEIRSSVVRTLDILKIKFPGILPNPDNWGALSGE